MVKSVVNRREDENSALETPRSALLIFSVAHQLTASHSSAYINIWGSIHMVMTGALRCWYYKISAQLIAIPLGLTSSYVREENLLEEEKQEKSREKREG